MHRVPGSRDLRERSWIRHPLPARFCAGAQAPDQPVSRSVLRQLLGSRWQKIVPCEPIFSRKLIYALLCGSYSSRTALLRSSFASFSANTFLFIFVEAVRGKSSLTNTIP